MVSLLSLVSNIRHFGAVYHKMAASAGQIFGSVHIETATASLYPWFSMLR